MDEVAIGRVTHFFPKVHVAVLELSTGELRLGDSIRVLGAYTDITQAVESMQIEHTPVAEVHAGQAVAIRLVDRARVGDVVFRVLRHTHIEGLSIGEEAAAP